MVCACGGENLPQGPDGLNRGLLNIMSMVLEVVGTISGKDLIGSTSVYTIYNVYGVAGGGAISRKDLMGSNLVYFI
jgi:hypothetical protein